MKNLEGREKDTHTTLFVINLGTFIYIYICETKYYFISQRTLSLSMTDATRGYFYQY